MTAVFLLASLLMLQAKPLPLAPEATAAHSSQGTPVVRETVKPLSREKLPNVPGKELIAVEVLFPPGAASVPHRHPPSAFIYAYVLEGRIVSAVGQEAPRAYRAGESWIEEPGAFHRVTRNESRKETARLLVIFVAPEGESDLVRPADK